MDPRKKRITKINCTQIDLAIKNLKALYAKTKQYPSTASFLENCTDRLGVIKVFYAANVGYMEKSTRFPYRSKDLKVTYSDAKQIYTFARKPSEKRDPADSLWEPVKTVFELMIERAEWLEGKD